jgi:spore germination protein
LGTGLIVLPRRAAEYAGQDGWLVVLLLGFAVVVLGALLISVTLILPGTSFMNYTKKILSKRLAMVFGLGLIIKLVLSAGLEMRAFVYIARQMLLRTTPLPVVSGMMLFVCAYAAAKGIETRARVAEILLIVLLLPLFVLLIFAFFNTDYTNLLPMLVTPPKEVLSGVFRLGYIFAGLECLLLVSFYVQNKKKVRRSVITALAFAGGLAGLISLLTFAQFGAREIVAQPWPVLRMMDMFHLPGAFIERQDALVVSFWIISVFAICNAFIYFASALAWDLFNSREKKSPHSKYKQSHFVAFFALAAWGISCLPIQGEAIYFWLDRKYFTFGILYLIIFPLLLLFAAKIKRIKKPMAMLFIFLCLFPLTGCWDRIEIKNRAFAVAIAIDKSEEGYEISLAIPAMNESDNEEGFPINKAEGKTVTEAFQRINAGHGKSIYLGQAKLLVLGDGILKDPDMFQSVLDALDKNTSIDRRMIVLAAKDKGSEILKTKATDETMPGLLIADIYRDKFKWKGVTFKQDFERLCAGFRETGYGLIPYVKLEEDELSLTGAAVMKGYKKIGSLDGDALRGIAWCWSSLGEGAVLTVYVDGKPVPMTVIKHKVKPVFTEKEDKLHCQIRVQVRGRVGEFALSEELGGGSTYENLRLCYARLISDEINQSASAMQFEWAMDGYNWLDYLYKWNHSLYKKYATDWPRAFSEMEMEPLVSVTFFG